MTRIQPLGLQPSFGFGDRIGLATPGHVAALDRVGRAAGIAPIFPQQSIREMTRTGRSAQQVMDDALAGMDRAGWTGGSGADADHLKTRADVAVTAAAGFCFFTIDPSDHVDGAAAGYDEATVRAKFRDVRDRIDWFDRYRNTSVRLDTGTVIELDELTVMRAAVKYGLALNHGLDLADSIRALHEPAGRDYEIELSLDETPEPTTLAEHYIIADQCLDRGMKLVSLAPRFVGEFEKGIDYRGDPDAVERSLVDHAAIAAMLGPYKLSLHSGSDKLSLYPALARATRGRFHVKTAGTSYLEALRVVAIHDPALFRSICTFARERYDTDKATYQVHATVAAVPAPERVDDDRQLQRLYLERWDDVSPGAGFTAPGRQLLHCTFGSVLTHPVHGPAVRACLAQHPATYAEVLDIHFGHHLAALRAGM